MSIQNYVAYNARANVTPRQRMVRNWHRTETVLRPRWTPPRLQDAELMSMGDIRHRARQGRSLHVMAISTKARDVEAAQLYFEHNNIGRGLLATWVPELGREVVFLDDAMREMSETTRAAESMPNYRGLVE